MLVLLAEGLSFPFQQGEFAPERISARTAMTPRGPLSHPT